MSSSAVTYMDGALRVISSFISRRHKVYESYYFQLFITSKFTFDW